MKQRSYDKDTKKNIQKFVLFKKNEDIILDTLIKSKILKDPILKNKITLHEIIMNLKKINNLLIEKTKEEHRSDRKHITNKTNSIKKKDNKAFAHPFDNLHYGQVNNTVLFIRNKENKKRDTYKKHRKSKAVKKQLSGVLDTAYRNDTSTNLLSSHLNKSLDNYFQKYYMNKNIPIKECAKCSSHIVMSSTSTNNMDFYNHYVNPVHSQKSNIFYMKNSPFNTQEMQIIVPNAESYIYRSFSNSSSTYNNKIKESYKNRFHFCNSDHSNNSINSYNCDDIQSLCSFKSTHKTNKNKEESKKTKQAPSVEDTTIESHKNCIHRDYIQKNNMFELEGHLTLDHTKQEKVEEYSLENSNDTTKQTETKNTARDENHKEKRIEIYDMIKKEEIIVTNEKTTNNRKNTMLNESKMPIESKKIEREGSVYNIENSYKEPTEKEGIDTTLFHVAQKEPVEKSVQESSNASENNIMAKPMEQVISYQTVQMKSAKYNNTLNKLLSNVCCENNDSIEIILNNSKEIKNHRNQRKWGEVFTKFPQHSIEQTQKMDTIVLIKDNILIKKEWIHLSNVKKTIKEKIVSHKKEQRNYNTKLSYEHNKVKAFLNTEYKHFKRIKKINKYNIAKREKLNHKLAQKYRKKKYLFYLIDKIKMYNTFDGFKKTMHQIKKYVWQNEHVKQNQQIKWKVKETPFPTKPSNHLCEMNKKKTSKHLNGNQFGRTDHSKGPLFKKNIPLTKHTYNTGYTRRNLNKVKNSMKSICYTKKKNYKKKITREATNLNDAEFLIQALIDKIVCDKMRYTNK